MVAARTFALAALLGLTSAQTFQRLGGCPDLGCILPPDRIDFLAGQNFDIRLEVHAPVNGTEAFNRGVPDTSFTFTITPPGGSATPAAQFFNTQEPSIERWNFTWYEDLFAFDARRPSAVNVAAKAYRQVSLTQPGEYIATLNYYNGTQTTARWMVRDVPQERRAKNILFFIGDGMTTSMITAARLIAHQNINGHYETTMAMDGMPVVGHQATHSLDTFITDSANSATTLYTGKKTSVNALNVWVDSSPSVYDDPKVENLPEMFVRLLDGHVGIVSTAYLADATPGAITAHNRDRGDYPAVVESFLRPVNNYSWDGIHASPDVIFGGGAENFYQPGGLTYQGLDYYDEFTDAGFNVVFNNTALLAAPNNQRTLGVFSESNMAKWLDRNVYPQNLRNQSNSPTGDNTDALDQPGLKEMTLKAIDILQQTSGDNGWFLMSEAASIDKQMHALDYERALGELLEMDDTIKASIEHLAAIGELEDTLIVVTADHGHGFDVAGSVDTLYLNSQRADRMKRNAVGVYERSGQSQYVEGPLDYPEGQHFPGTWDPRYTLAQGTCAFPDKREDYQVNKDGPRTPAVSMPRNATNYYVNPADSPMGYVVNGTLPTNQAQGVHSLTDVPVYALGPCQELFGGSYDSTNIFFQMAQCLGLGRAGQGLPINNGTAPGANNNNGNDNGNDNNNNNGGNPGGRNGRGAWRGSNGDGDYEQWQRYKDEFMKWRSTQGRS